MLGLLYGLSAGIVLGLAVGSFLFRVAVRKRSYARLDISADFDDNIPEPMTGGHVSKKLTKVLNFTAEWVRMPDFERVVWFNTVIKMLWPHIGKVMYKQVLAQAAPALKDVCKMVPMGILESVDIDQLDLGDAPTRLGGIKVYDTHEDNLITEVPIMFGSHLVVRVAIKLRIPYLGYAIHLPVEVKQVQMRAVVRFTAAPLTETLPCVGGVTISLLKAPYWDAQFRIADSVDFMAVPLLHEAIQYAAKRAIETLMVYPNRMEFPILENFGITPPPVGMLQVKMCRAAGLPASDFLGKSDPYCLMNVREERVLRTRTISNTLNPTWDQYFDFLVDDIDAQCLSILVKDDDMGFEDDILCGAELPFDEIECCRKPREWVPVQVQLLEANSAGIVSDAKSFLRQGPGVVKKLQPKNVMPGSKKKRQAKKARKAAERETNGEFGTLWMEMRYQPFISPKRQEQLNKAAMRQQREEDAQLGRTRDDTDGEPKEGDQNLEESTNRERPGQQTSLKDTHGVLTVNVIRARDLEYKETNEVDPYCRLTLFDPERGATQAYRTSTQVNDATPRWNQKFDFIDIPASSYLTCTVFDKASLLASRKKLKPWERKEDKKLGYVRIAVEEVARNKDIKDDWPLLEADKGDLVLRLHWQQIVLEEPCMEEEEFDWRQQQDIADQYHAKKARESRNGSKDGAAAIDPLVASPIASPVGVPLGVPLGLPPGVPLAAPLDVPLALPTGQPVSAPLGSPIGQPVTVPLGSPNAQPLGAHLGSPTGQPISVPLGSPTGVPLAAPLASPIGQPVGAILGSPNAQPVGVPLVSPNGQPLVVPLGVPPNSAIVPSPGPAVQPQHTATQIPNGTVHKHTGHQRSNSAADAPSAVPVSAANPEGRKAAGFIDDMGQSTLKDDSIGTFVYGPPS